MNSLKGKVAIITGASRGIGAATAYEFAKHGVSLVLHGRNADALAAVSDKCRSMNMDSTHKKNAVMVLGDLESEDTIDDIVATSKSHFNRLDVLFNNAGFMHPDDDVIHMGGTVAAMDAMYNIYVRVPYLLTQKLIPDLAQTKGTVINCSTAGTQIVEPRATAYCTQKAAMDNLTRIMALSLCNKGIRVNSVNPAHTVTDFISRAVGDDIANHVYSKVAKFTPLEQKLPTPEEIAGIVAFLASDLAGAITGENIQVDKALSLAHPLADWTKYA